MVHKIKQGLNHPVIGWLGGITIGAVASFFMILGGYKNAFDQMKTDIKETKTTVDQIRIDVAVLKTKYEIKPVSFNNLPNTTGNFLAFGKK